jgi:putative transposase
MKRHSRAEISVALAQAQEMTRRGQSQAAICRALGISVMTLLRWRKEHDVPPFLSHDETSPTRNQNEVRVESLLLENQRLRKIVTDLLLEKVKMEEAFGKKPKWNVRKSGEEKRRS